MTVNFSVRTTYDVSPQRLFDLLTDPAFLERKALDMGADVAKVTRHEELDGTLVLVTDVEEPAHWGKGQDHRTMTTRINPKTFDGTWVHRQHGMEDRAKVEGSFRIVELGESRCEYINEGAIEIRVPMMGKMIEKKIKAGIEKGTAKETAYIKRALLDAA
jgi:hypothetical protein